jgi:hypothetical protein
MSTIFYSKSDAIDKINTRKAIYSKEKRDSDAYLWLYQKIAYANAYAGGASLNTKTGGGLGTTDNSLYEKPGIVKNEEQEDLKTRFLPKAHLVSLKTSYAGDYGSTIKCEIAFTVYSLSQLVAYEGFFKIGADMSADWGWYNAGSAGSSERFSGKVVNFSWSVNADGGADCTSTGIGKGIDILGANAKLPVAVADKVSAAVGDITVNATSVISTITMQATTVIETILPNTTDSATGLGCVEYSDDWASSETRVAPAAPAPKTPTTPAVDPKRIYVSLARVITLYSNALQEASTDNPKPKLNCTSIALGGVTIGHVPPAPFASANPTECIFPGAATYGAEGKGKIFIFEGLDINTAGDLSQIMINVNWLAKAFESVGKTTAKTDKAPDLSVSAFLKILFAMIETNSGGAFKLSAAARPKESHIIDIIEAQYMPLRIPVTEIPAVTQNSTARSISVSAKIPAELAMVASTATAGTGVVNAAALIGFTPLSSTPKNVISSEELTNALTLVGNQGTSAENVSAVQTALKASIKAATDTSVMYPIDFSFTVDGLSGFIFGNAVKTNYLPGKYRGDRCVFTVTTVEHNVSGNDWTTTCNTVFRLRPA